MRQRKGWHPAHWLDSPHRLGFVAAALVMSAAALGWLAIWLHGPALALPPVTAHSLAFVFGFLPLFFAGFLFTVGPRWRGLPVDDAAMRKRTRALRWPIALQAGAWLAWWPLLALAGRGAAALALAIAAAGWTGIVILLWRELRQPAPRRSGALLAAALAYGLGAAGLWLAVGALVAAQDALLQRLPAPALWAFVGGVFAAVATRLLPLESMLGAAHGAAPPAWAVPTLLGTALAAGASAAAHAAPDATLAVVLAGLLAGAAAVSALIAARWLRRQPPRAHLVAMLQVGWLWWTLALALQAAAMAFAAAGRPGLLGAAPLHALALGWMGSTLFAMASRVAGAFSGQRQTADASAWWLFGLVQAAALARVTAALWPPATPALGTLAASAWALAALGWLLIYGRWLGLPRPTPKVQRGT